MVALFEKQEESLLLFSLSQRWEDWCKNELFHAQLSLHQLYLTFWQLSFIRGGLENCVNKTYFLLNEAITRRNPRLSTWQIDVDPLDFVQIFSCFTYYLMTFSLHVQKKWFNWILPSQTLTFKMIKFWTFSSHYW